MYPAPLDTELKYRTVYGNMSQTNYEPTIGWMEFHPTARLIYRSRLLSAQQPFKIAFDESGYFEVVLLCTDVNPGIHPQGWAWAAKEFFRGGTDFWFLLPYGNGTPISIHELAPLPEAPPLITGSMGPEGDTTWTFIGSTDPGDPSLIPNPLGAINSPIWVDTGEDYPFVGGTTDHSLLVNRDAPDQHPIGAITGLQEALGNVPGGGGAGVTDHSGLTGRDNPGSHPARAIDGLVDPDIGWLYPTLLNGWTGYVRYRRTAEGNVQLQGQVDVGSGTGTVFRMPMGYRPGGVEYLSFPAAGTVSVVRVDIMETGEVTIAASANLWVSLAGIIFYGEQGAEGEVPPTEEEDDMYGDHLIIWTLGAWKYRGTTITERPVEIPTYEQGARAIWDTATDPAFVNPPPLAAVGDVWIPHGSVDPTP